MEHDGNNAIVLRGSMASRPVFSHTSRGIRFFTFPLEVLRLSGTYDRLNIICREDALAEIELTAADKLCIHGEIRSFNNKSGVGPRLVITVLAREIALDCGEDMNEAELRGAICKAPNLRVTPLGRDICDLMLAVNRKYGRTDYLPCIVWGWRAREVSIWEVGTQVCLTGRMQSRIYLKSIGSSVEEKTAYEISAVAIFRADEDPELRQACI